MTNLTISGSILKIYKCNKAANIFLKDGSNPKSPVFKVALWGSDANNVLSTLDKGDELSIIGKVYCIDSNKYGDFIDLRKCKLIDMIKIQRKFIPITNTDAVEETSSLPLEGEE